MTKGEFIYEGKAKKIYHVVEDDSLVFIEYKNSFTAFNGEKKAEMEAKAEVNCQIAGIIFEYLKSHSVETHWHENTSSTTMICDKLNIIPLEVVVRNRLAGSTAKKFHYEEGKSLEEPLVELYYKDDDLGDPFINDEQALMLKCVEEPSRLELLKSMAKRVNKLLIPFFAKSGIDLIDFKLEYGTNNKGRLVLADEITPDTCRLWDSKTGEKMDKDRFRRDLGNVMESYQEVLSRLKALKESL